MMSKLEKEALWMFVSEMRHARKIKRTVIKLAQEEPERVLEAMGKLDEREQKYLGWLRMIAYKYLTH